MTAMVAKGWVTYSLNLHKWEWHVPNDYPKAVADVLYRKGLIDSKQALHFCLHQSAGQAPESQEHPHHRGE